MKISLETELQNIAHKIGALEGKFINSPNLGLYLNGEDEAQFKQLVLEAISLIDVGFGGDNRFSEAIESNVQNGSGGYLGGPSLNCVQATRGLVGGAINHLRHHESLSPTRSLEGKAVYIDPSRIAELQSQHSSKFDLTRLIRLCEELNVVTAHECLMSIAMLVRAIVDHIPPIFGQQSFAQVANNYAGSKSFKDSMKHLDASLRHIADAHLHTQIRKCESLPTFSQVDFRSDVDVLLGEIIRLLK